MLVVPPISRRRNADRARRAGAVWAGIAQFDARDSYLQAPVVAGALSTLGSLYGSAFSSTSRRIIGGRLWVYPDRVEWEPGIWLGRGHAEPWRLPLGEVDGAAVEALPLPTVRQVAGILRTAQGEIRFLIIDPKGFRRAMESLSIPFAQSSWHT
jgi:hypothetical protein